MILSTELEDYLANHSEKEPRLLKQLLEETELECRRPHMISGAYQGRLLSMISKLVKPKKILEIGTYTGYSALCLAEGLSANGALITIDKDASVTEISDRYFNKSVYRDQISQITGNALEIIPNLEVKFDLVFMDADKKNYVNYLNLLLEKMNSGAILLSDNVLWKGKVLDANSNDAFTQAIDSYNKVLATHPKLETLMLPVRDGISLSRVKG